MSQYYSFEELKDVLGLSDDEIKKMVSEGELRAFRDEDKMKFKKEDVEALRRSRVDVDVGGIDDDDIILLDDDPAGADVLTEELVLEDDDDFDLGSSSTEALDAQDTFVEGEVGGATEPIEVIEDEEVDEVDAPAAVSTGSRRLPRARPSATGRYAPPPSAGGPVWIVAACIGMFVVLVYASMFVIGIVGDSNPGTTKGVTDKVYEWVHDSKPPVRNLGEGR